VGEHDGHEFAGGTGGNRSGFFVYPKDDLAVIVLTNAQGARPESLAQGIAMRYLQD
jgi:CubicO group peptidase (beta-lactamase class C family)